MEPVRGALGSPLRGIRVVSMAEQYPGPLCTQLLADLGAEITQVERPGGDPQRSVNEWLFRAASLGKSSLELNLKDPIGLSRLREIVKVADVFIEGFRPGVVDRLGVGYSDLTELNRKLVYCSISGYGQTGPYRLLAGHNVNYEAVTGVLDAAMRPELEVSYFAAAPPLGDIASGMTAALGIVAALRTVESTNEPVYLDISIADSLVLALGPNLTRAMNGHNPWSVREPAYGMFETADGWLALGISYEDHFWVHLCEVLGIEEWAAMARPERMERRAEIRRRVAETLHERPSAHWVDRFGDVVPCSRVHQLEEVRDDPQIRSRGLIVEAVDEKGRPFTTVATPFSRVVDDRDPPLRRVPPLGSAASELLGDPVVSSSLDLGVL